MVENFFGKEKKEYRRLFVSITIYYGEKHLERIGYRFVAQTSFDLKNLEHFTLERRTTK